MLCPKKYRKANPAFTLLEVILALAILAGAVAVLGEIMSIAGRNASEAQALTRAQLLASSIMDEMLSGVTEATTVTEQPLDTTDEVPWVYSVNILSTSYPELVALEVIVEQDTEPQFNPISYHLVRWISSASTASSQEQSTSTMQGGGSGY